MSRRRRAERKIITPDSKYQHQVISKLINYTMLNGKKAIAEKIVYHAIEESSRKLAVTPVETFEQIIGNIKPMIEVRSRRVGGATYQVPTPVRPERSISLAIRWLLIAARKRSGRTMEENLSNEMLDAYNNRGAAIKKREEVHKMAEANRAFAHFGFVNNKSK